MQKLLERIFLGSLTVSVANLELPSLGRGLRESGNKELQGAIDKNGFMEIFNP